MILRRLTTSLQTVNSSMRDQNWAAIAIEFVLVVSGVFLGIVAANWNEARLKNRDTQRLLRQLDTQLEQMQVYIESVEQYYQSAGRYADRAAAGWNADPSVSDQEFVIAAYQASQVNGIGTNSGVWPAILGADQLREIDDLEMREDIAAVLTFDYELVDLRSVSTPYRQEVRKIIPNDIQAAIRGRCGDKPIGRAGLFLPPKCDLKLPTDLAARTAAALRTRPQLLAELHWHRAAVANQMANALVLKGNAEALTRRIGND